MKNKIFKIFYIQLILFVILINLCGCSNNNENSKETANQKVKSELSYLDSRITTMINTIDNVKLKNYEVSEEPNKDEGNNDENTSSAQDSDSTSTGKNIQSETNGSNSSNLEQGQENPKKYQLVATNILIQSQDTNWDNLKNNVESLQYVWPTIVLDLYEIGVNNQDILSFSNELNTLVKAVKEENKEDALNLLSSIYKNIPKFMDGKISDEITRNIYATKSNVFLAYSLVEKDDWEAISNYLSEAENSYNTVLNKVIEGERKEKEYNINKAYIELKELQNCVKQKDKDIFLIKYKNLLEELDTI